MVRDHRRRRRRLLALIPEGGGFVAPRDDLPASTQARLRAAVTAFVDGYRLTVQYDDQHGDQHGDPRALRARLDAIDAERIGFFYEGAGMALVCADVFMPRESSQVGASLELCDRSRGALLSIGAGCAQARLSRSVTDLPDGLTDECRPFMEDGYGFHQGMFHAYRFHGKRMMPFISPAFDRGLGRSLWFVSGADASRVQTFVRRFASERHPALWHGVGVACAFTGGVERAELCRLRDAAGVHVTSLRQGVQASNRSHATMEGLPASMRLANAVLEIES